MYADPSGYAKKAEKQKYVGRKRVVVLLVIELVIVEEIISRVGQKVPHFHHFWVKSTTKYNK